GLGQFMVHRLDPGIQLLAFQKTGNGPVMVPYALLFESLKEVFLEFVAVFLQIEFGAGLLLLGKEWTACHCRHGRSHPKNNRSFHLIRTSNPPEMGETYFKTE